MTEETKKCPYCGAEILGDAMKCRHCRGFLDQPKKEDRTTDSGVSETSHRRGPDNSRFSARLFILPLLGMAAVFTGWESIKVVDAYCAMQEAGQEAGRAAALLGKAIAQKDAFVSEIGLDEYARRASGLTARHRQGLMDWLNSKDAIKEAGIRCVSVSLNSESSDSYKGPATFDNGEQVCVEVGREEDSGESYFRTDLPLLVAVRQATLPSCDHTTIGRAFDAFFGDPRWEYKLSENGTRSVEFTGQIKKRIVVSYAETLPILLEDRDRLGVRFVLQPEDNNAIKLYSMQIQPAVGNDPNNVPARLRNSDIIYGCDLSNTQFINRVIEEIHGEFREEFRGRHGGIPGTPYSIRRVLGDRLTADEPEGSGWCARLPDPTEVRKRQTQVL